MRKVAKRIVLFVFVQVFIICILYKPAVIIAAEQQEHKYEHSGILERNQYIDNDSYLVTLSFPHNTLVKVILELDLARCGPESGGHVQFAFTKDEAHSLWADDISLYPNVMTTYEETFSLYAGTYLFEMHLIREDDEHVPFKVRIETSEQVELPDIDEEATCWFQDDFAKTAIYISKKGKVVDVYQKVVISAWTDIRRNQIVYSSSNKKVATVSKKGKMAIKRSGKTTISVKLPNGFTITESILVYNKQEITNYYCKMYNNFVDL